MRTYRFVLDTDRLNTYGIHVRHSRLGEVEFIMTDIGREKEGARELFLHYLEKGFVKIEEV